MRFSVLGPIEVETADGERQSIGSANQRRILAMLLSRADMVVGTDELIEGLWGDAPPASAVQSLRTYVSRLRALVGDRLVRHDSGYSIDCADGELDARDFEDDVANGRFSDALQRWRGRPYGDAADLGVVWPDALRLETLRSMARSGRLDELLTKGQLADAISGAEAFVVEDPVNEVAWATMIRALARSGRVADALRAFRRATRGLAEAGLEPSEVLRAAEAEALADAPPIARRHIPPRPLTVSIALDAEIERLGELTSERRLVTIVGPGGVGKTRLSMEVGRIAAHRHALGTRTVELSRIDDPRAIAPTVRRALDLGEGEPSLIEGLGGLDAMLVLDNCEHVVDAVAAEVPALLAGGDRLRILATSREPLGVPGELRWALAPLSTVGPSAPALMLLVERARDVGVEVDPTDPRARALVSQLDGLPLAVEMAAAQLATIGLADLSDDIERTIASLGTSHRQVADRHGTLRAVLAWSESLLTPDERSVLAEFSIFSGPVGADDLPAAIEADEPLVVVRDLAERSLVTVHADGGARARYGSLQTIRQFGRERLRAQDRTDVVSGRHARWFTDAAEAAAVAFDGVHELDAAVRIDTILDELRAAHTWACRNDLALAMRLSHALFQPAFQGLRLEIFEWSLALADVISPDDHGAARLYGEVALGLTLLGRIDEAHSWAERALACPGQEMHRQAAYGTLADIALYGGDLERSVVLARAHDELAERHGTQTERAYGKVSVALPLAYLGRDEEAIATIPAQPPSAASPTALAWLAYGRGEVLLDRDHDSALGELDRAVALADSVGSHFLSGVAQISAASLRARTGDTEGAVGAMYLTIDRFTARGNATHLHTALRNLPTLLVRLDEWSGAAEMLGGLSAVSISPTYGDEAERLTAAERAVRSALDDDDFARAYRRGAARGLDETAGVALTLLDALRARRPDDGSRHAT